MKTKQTKQTTNDSKDWVSRNLIALVITSLVVLATGAIAVFAIIKDDFTFIGQTLLPLWGTWMGTVMAFYFGKANFEAGSNASKKMTSEEKMESLLVRDTMVPLKDIVALYYDDDSSKSLKEILDLPQFKPYNRFAVFDKSNLVKAMIHRGTFYEFMFKNKDADGILKLEDLLKSEDENIKNNLSFGFGFVKLEATLLDAKKVIDSVAECQDVFITQNGNRNEPVLGLLTNNKILELLKK
jgi:hypothetical protein